MRVLRFIVDGQLIKKDPACNFDNLVPGTEGFVQANFTFSKEWEGCAKVVAFYSPLGREYPPRVLADGKTCIIPDEALQKRKFKMQVIGKKSDFKITTNKVTVSQIGDKT